MLRCGCGMMIECEIKTGQTVESIEHTRREGGDGVGMKIKAGRLWNDLKNNEMRWEIKILERGKTGEEIRREGGETVGIKT